MLRWQEPDSGLFYQLPALPDVKGNYLETSGSLMVAYSLLKGARLGVLAEPKYRAAGEKILVGIELRQFTVHDGKVELHGICKGAGLGPAGNLRRNGTVEYYLSEDVVHDEQKGVGVCMMAYAEYLQAKQAGALTDDFPKVEIFNKGYDPIMPGDPAFEPGDRVALPMEDGTAPEMLVTHFVWRYRGRQTLKGVGRNPYLGGTTDGATEKALRRLQNSAESKRIVYYSFTNPAELAVQTVETPAVAIAFTAVEETSAMFLAQLLLDAAPDTGKVLTLTVRYYINDVPVENFAPQQRLETGAHTLALFYPFASVEAGTVTRLSVRLVCAGGTVKIAPYGIKATVTGQGMASETPWDGTLECEETLLPIAIKARSIDV